MLFWLAGKPYRLFFCLALPFAWVGVLHWLLFAAGVLPEYRAPFHATTQVQAFMMCLVLGFLFTMIPGRTQSPPPGPATVLIAVLALVATVVLAWFEQPQLAQAAWLVLMADLLVFILRRIGRGGRRPPNAFVWIPMALLMGLCGSVLQILDPHDVAGHIGRRLTQQGMLLGLIAGVGSLVVPLLTRAESSVDGTRASGDVRARLLHVATALALAATFVVEILVEPAAGYTLRAAVLLLALLMTARIHRLPITPGLHRRLVWIAAWCMPLGYLACAMWPSKPQLGLHIVFLGGFALMGLSVALHVTLAHGGAKERTFTYPWQVCAFALAMLTALVARAAYALDQDVLWLGTATVAFLVATIAWAILAVPYAAGWRSSPPATS